MCLTLIIPGEVHAKLLPRLKAPRVTETKINHLQREVEQKTLRNSTMKPANAATNCLKTLPCSVRVFSLLGDASSIFKYPSIKQFKSMRI